MAVNAGTRLSKEVRETELLCILSGKLMMSTQRMKNHVIDGGHIMLLAPNTHVTVDMLDDSQLMLFIIDKPSYLCECCPLESLYEFSSAKSADANTGMPSILKFTKPLEDYLNNFRNCLGEGLKCVHYLDIKIRELMFILRAFYSRTELGIFFRPIISNDMGFSDFILKNYRSVKTVDELAKLSNYSRSGFKAHFHKTFGMSTSAWLREKKAHNVYYELTSSTKPLQQISEEYNFASASHMSIFCRECFGMPPGKIRKSAGKNSPVGGKYNTDKGTAELPPPKVSMDTIE